MNAFGNRELIRLLLGAGEEQLETAFFFQKQVTQFAGGREDLEGFQAGYLPGCARLEPETVITLTQQAIGNYRLTAAQPPELIALCAPPFSLSPSRASNQRLQPDVSAVWRKDPPHDVAEVLQRWRNR